MTEIASLILCVCLIPTHAKLAALELEHTHRRKWLPMRKGAPAGSEGRRHRLWFVVHLAWIWLLVMIMVANVRLLCL